MPLTVEPITVEDAKTYIGLSPDLSDENSLVQLLIITARSWLEEILWRTIVPRSRVEYFHDFDCDSQRFYLPYGPIHSLTSVEYLDSEEVWQAVDSDKYRLHTEMDHIPPYVCPAPDCYWPTNSTNQDAPVTVRITYAAGERLGDGTADTPSELKAALLILIKALYERRDMLGCEAASRPVPDAVLWLSSKYDLKHDFLTRQKLPA